MKTKGNKINLFIGITLIAFSELVIFFLSEIDMNASLVEVYKQALAVKFWNGMAILGWIICFIWGIAFWVRNRQRQHECKICGAIIVSKEDLFCRECGAKL